MKIRKSNCASAISRRVADKTVAATGTAGLPNKFLIFSRCDEPAECGLCSCKPRGSPLFKQSRHYSAEVRVLQPHASLEKHGEVPGIGPERTSSGQRLHIPEWRGLELFVVRLHEMLSHIIRQRNARVRKTQRLADPLDHELFIAQSRT